MGTEKYLRKFGEATIVAGKWAAGKTADGISHVKETYDKGKEIKVIIGDAEKAYTEAQTRQQIACEEAFDIAEKLIQVQLELVTNQFERYKRMQTYCVEHDADCQNIHNIMNYVEMTDFEERTIPKMQNTYSHIAGGAVAGIASGAAAIGFTTLFGVASTGTAISSLSGAAAYSATLAALGGGSVAAGGLGMAGGIVVLGGLVAVPAVTIGGILWDKKTHSDYEKALNYKKEVEAQLPKLEENREMFLNIFRNIQSAIYEISNVSHMLDNILNIYEHSTIIVIDQEEVELCEKAIVTANKLLTLQFVYESGEINHSVENEIIEIHNDFSEIEFLFGKHLMAKKNASSELIEKIFRNRIKKYQSVPYKDKEITKYFRNTFDIARKEICILSPWVGDFVIRDEFSHLIQIALERGVTIKIAYGIGNIAESYANVKTDSRMKKTEEKIRQLCDRYGCYGELFKVKRGNSHGKLLICDDNFYMIGSFNFLSFEGTYSDDDQRGEIADYSENPEMIAFYKNSIFNF